jgi:trehalose synthase
MKSAGAAVIWRCHVGLDRPNDMARVAWAFLEPYLARRRVRVFA